MTKRKKPIRKKQKPEKKKQKHLLWANVFCLLDTSSGASISARQMLIQLVKAGYKVSVIGATIFDHERGKTKLLPSWEQIENVKHKFINLEDDFLSHRTFVTQSSVRANMTAHEESLWFEYVRQFFEQEKPDYLWFYGGFAFDMFVANEAKYFGIKTLAYLVNGNYSGNRWHRDVDLILTDSQSTADYYKNKSQTDVKAIGYFIENKDFVAGRYTHKNLLFINPSYQKGAAIVVQLALALEEKRPDIMFEVVESRGHINEVIELLTEQQGHKRSTLKNLTVTPNQTDMRPVYSRARCLLAPSLWWESGARVLIEAMLNHIPAIITQSGGSPEIVGDAGVTLKLPAEYHQAPYLRVPGLDALQPVVEKIEQIYDDEDFFQSLRVKAAQRALHLDIERNTQRLIAAIESLDEEEK